MKAVLEAAALYTREIAEVENRFLAWRDKSQELLAYLTEVVKAVQEKVPYFRDNLSVETMFARMENEGVIYENHQLMTVLLYSQPRPVATFHHPESKQYCGLIEAGFQLYFAPALNGEIVVSIVGHAVQGNEPPSQELRVFSHPSLMDRPAIDQLLAKAFDMGVHSSVLYSRDTLPSDRTIVGFRTQRAPEPEQLDTTAPYAGEGE